ncbi:BTB/POZ domain-containing protein 6 [Elsinoe australis]|uniref:BTB/POZ domain-containing protein 6 n=1 Tax=Elsinoe australis TaxID=40998 RepID=A0A4V6DVB0_9PEZI|nr:BTB/POZ domain-containing protein 6 [Elsinoe australis]
MDVIPTAQQISSEYFDSDVMSDVTIVFGDKTVRAHKILLISQSPYFKGLFCGIFKESKAKEVELKDDDTEAVHAMLKYIYTSKLPVTQGKVNEAGALLLVNIHIASDKYQVGVVRKAAAAAIADAFNDKAVSDSIFTALAVVPPQVLLDDAETLASGIKQNLKDLSTLPSFCSLLDAHGKLARVLLQLSMQQGKSFESICKFCKVVVQTTVAKPTKAPWCHRCGRAVNLNDTVES